MEDASEGVAVVVGVIGPLLLHEAPPLAKFPAGRSTGCAVGIPCMLSFKQTNHTIATTGNLVAYGAGASGGLALDPVPAAVPPDGRPPAPESTDAGSRRWEGR